VRGVADTRGSRAGALGRLAPLRARLTVREPVVQGHALRRLLGAQRQLAQRLRSAYPEKLDEITAAAVVGSFVGAMVGVALAAMRDDGAVDDPDRVLRELQRALDVAVNGIASVDRG